MIVKLLLAAIIATSTASSCSDTGTQPQVYCEGLHGGISQFIKRQPWNPDVVVCKDNTIEVY